MLEDWRIAIVLPVLAFLWGSALIGIGLIVSHFERRRRRSE